MGDGIEPVIVDGASVNEILTRQTVLISDRRPKTVIRFRIDEPQATIACAHLHGWPKELTYW
jgi:hypothetical protein